jgi:RNA-directed DNA polymerase
VSGQRRKTRQLKLAFRSEDGGEAPNRDEGRAERLAAEQAPESPADDGQLMEAICSRENLQAALKRVQSNKGGPGVDGMTVGQLPAYLRHHWPTLREQLLTGRYRPAPVRRVAIPKPSGGERKLGIPTVVDRFIQQAVLQVLQPAWDPTFSDHSYGFRPGRSAHQAVSAVQAYIAAGHTWVVDLDLEKFFDRVNHDRLMALVARRVSDKRLLTLLRSYLNAGVLDGDLVRATTEGTPQGGPLSPLLSNLVLDELDRELERRGHRFVRYADDVNIYVRSERSGLRVMASLERFITRKLRLTVNSAKSAVARPWERTFLGFTFTRRHLRRRVSPGAICRFKMKVRRLTGRMGGRSLRQVIRSLGPLLRGWRSYFGFAETNELRDLDGWIARRLRCMLWKHWQRGRRRFAELRRRGVPLGLAAGTIRHIQGPWRASRTIAMSQALPRHCLDDLGLPRLWLAVR